MANVDWVAIKNEYVNTNISQRKLAEKYEISFNTLKDRANRESWAKAKKEQHNRITTETQQKTAEIIVESETDRITKLLGLTDTAQEKISVCLTQLGTYIDMFGGVHQSEVLDVNRLKKLVSALKDIKEIIKVDTTDEIDKLDAVLKKIEGNI